MSVSNGTCSAGGTWYACTDASPYFSGCCTSNPCAGNGCPSTDLRAAELGAGYGIDGPNYPIDSSYYPNSKCADSPGQWFTCADAGKSGGFAFQGCCDKAASPCANKSLCPQANLHPAAFSDVGSRTDSSVVCKNGDWYSCLTQNPPFQGCCLSNPCTGDGGTCIPSQAFPILSIAAGDGVVSYFSSATSPSTSTAARSTGTTQSGSLTTSAASATATTSTSPLPSVSPGPNVALIAGASAGGVFVGILVLVIIAFFVRRCLKKRKDAAICAGPPGGIGESISKGPMATTTPYNDEAYYPSQSIHGVPSPFKVGPPLSPNPNLSPSPPAYQSPQRSPRRDTYVSEIDSGVVHEIGGGQDDMQRMSGGGDGGWRGSAGQGRGLGLGVRHVSELPDRSG